jgi:hypothetical protein
MKRLAVFSLVVLLVLVAALPAAAQRAPGSERLKLKVFFHYPKPGKPGPKPGVCDPTEPDDVTTYGLTPWKQSGTVTYHVNVGSIPGSVQNAQTAITNSYAVWESKANNKVHFVQGAPTSIKTYKYDGVYLLAWGRAPSGAIAVTYTWYNSATNQVLEQDIIMSASLPWSYTQASNPDAVCGDLYSYDVQNILTHEVGHIFGLDDLYDPVDQDLTMYGYGAKGELKKDTLGKGDIAGMAYLY